MTWAVAVPVLLAVAVHSGALFYWGGKLSTLVDQHDTEIKLLRSRWHDSAQILQRVVTTLEVVERQLTQLTERHLG